MQERERRLEAEAEAKRQQEEEEEKQRKVQEAAAEENEEEKGENINKVSSRKDLSIDVPVNDDEIKEEALKTLSSNKSMHSKHAQSL